MLFLSNLENMDIEDAKLLDHEFGLREFESNLTLHNLIIAEDSGTSPGESSANRSAPIKCLACHMPKRNPKGITVDPLLAVPGIRLAPGFGPGSFTSAQFGPSMRGIKYSIDPEEDLKLGDPMYCSDCYFGPALEFSHQAEEVVRNSHVCIRGLKRGTTVRERDGSILEPSSKQYLLKQEIRSMLRSAGAQNRELTKHRVNNPVILSCLNRL